MNLNAIRSLEPVDPQEYLALASQLSASPGNASRRTAIDRAYYAAFLTARNELIDRGYLSAVRGPETHIRVITALTEIARNSGITLGILRRARNRVTYETGPTNLPRPAAYRLK